MCTTRSLSLRLVRLACVGILLTACHGQTREVPVNATEATPADGCVIGTTLGSDGNVSLTKNTFDAHESIYMTLRSASAAAGSEVTVEILDPHGEEMRSLFGPLNQAHAVTFPFRNLEPGRYTARAHIGDKKLCELQFEVR